MSRAIARQSPGNDLQSVHAAIPGKHCCARKKCVRMSCFLPLHDFTPVRQNVTTREIQIRTSTNRWGEIRVSSRAGERVQLDTRGVRPSLPLAVSEFSCVRVVFWQEDEYWKFERGWGWVNGCRKRPECVILI